MRPRIKCLLSPSFWQNAFPGLFNKFHTSLPSIKCELLSTKILEGKNTVYHLLTTAQIIKEPNNQSLSASNCTNIMSTRLSVAVVHAAVAEVDDPRIARIMDT